MLENLALPRHQDAVNNDSSKLVIKKWGVVKIAIAINWRGVEGVGSAEMPISFDHSSRCPKEDNMLHKTLDLRLDLVSTCGASQSIRT